MESLIGVAILALMALLGIVIGMVSRSPRNQESQSQEPISFPIDAVILIADGSEAVGGVIDSVPWEAGANVLGECEVCTGIAEAGGSILEILFELFVW